LAALRLSIEILRSTDGVPLMRASPASGGER
jgi:hypothetical protein